MLTPRAAAVTVAVCLLIAAHGWADDRVIFVDDFVMEATVVGYDADSDRITLRVRYGTLAIPGNRVKAVEFDSTVVRAVPDGNAACLALAGFMERYAGYKSATEILEALRSRDGAPDSVLLRLAGLYEKMRNYPKALECLRNYLEKHPGDVSVQADLDRLMRELKKKGSEVVQETPATDVREERVEEGFEDGGWRIEPWGNPGVILYVPLGKLADRLLKVEFSSQGKDKTAVGKKLPPDVSDLTGSPICTMDAYNNTADPLEIAIAVVTLPGWKYYESKPISLPPRKWAQGLRVDFASKDFKCEETGWTYTSDIKNLKRTTQVLFLIYQTDGKGTVFFNNIGFLSPTALPPR